MVATSNSFPLAAVANTSVDGAAGGSRVVSVPAQERVMEDVILVPMRLVEPLRPSRSSQGSRRPLLPSLMTIGGSAPKCEGFAFAEARVGNGAARHLRRDSALSYLPAPSLPSSDCVDERDGSEGSSGSLCCSFTTETCDNDCREEDEEMNEIEVRGPTSIAMSRHASTRATGASGSKTALSPPVVSPGRSLELSTRLGMAKLKAELDARATADPPKLDKEESRGRLRSAKLRPLGYIPIDMKPKAACIGITPVSDTPRCISARPRSSTEAAREQSMAVLEEQACTFTRSRSAHAMRQSSLNISRDSGAVASAKAPAGQDSEAEVSSPESPQTEEPATARNVRLLEPEPFPRQISSPIPYNRHEVVEAGSSFSVRGYSSPPSDTPPPPQPSQLPFVVPTVTKHKQLVTTGTDADHKPGRVAMVVSDKPFRHSTDAFTTLRANSSFRRRYWSAGAVDRTSDPSASPSRKLHPLRGCVSPQPLTAVKGLRLHTSPPPQPYQSKSSNTAAPHPSTEEWRSKSAELHHSTTLTVET